MQLEVGDVVEGKVSGITKFGAFVNLSDEKTGMIHISEISTDFVNDIKDYLEIGQNVKTKIINISEKNEIALSIKRLMLPKVEAKKDKIQPFTKGNNLEKTNNFERQNSKKTSSSSFEEMLSAFKHKSEEKISDLKRATESKRRSFSKRSSQR